MSVHGRWWTWVISPTAACTHRCGCTAWTRKSDRWSSSPVLPLLLLRRRHRHSQPPPHRRRCQHHPRQRRRPRLSRNQQPLQQPLPSRSTRRLSSRRQQQLLLYQRLTRSSLLSLPCQQCRSRHCQRSPRRLSRSCRHQRNRSRLHHCSISSSNLRQLRNSKLRQHPCRCVPKTELLDILDSRLASPVHLTCCCMSRHASEPASVLPSCPVHPLLPGGCRAGSASGCSGRFCCR